MMNLVKVMGHSRKDLLNALQESVNIDADLTGDNGIEYTSDEALANGFDTTVEYLIDKVKDIENDDELLQRFYALCFADDPSYSEYDYMTLKNDSSMIEAIAITTHH